MEKIKGKIESIREESITLNGKLVNKLFVKIEGDQREFNALGNKPDNWKEGGEVELEYEVKTTDSGAVFYNIKNKPRTGKGYGGFGDVIKALTMPKISVGYERTVQVNQYEPKKVSVHVSMNSENEDARSTRGFCRDSSRLP